MWETNGPVFSVNAFAGFAAAFFETAALCFLMVKMARPRVERGTHVGYNEAAATATTKAVREFLMTTFPY
jgi:Cu/Ag efflux pump CusA